MGRPVAEGLYVTDAEGRVALVASRCTTCAAVRFPAADRCLRCGSTDVEPATLPRAGVLWSFTVQGFRPKSPPYAGTEPAGAFVPYGVGYVDLGDVVVEARLTEPDPERLRIGMPMELVTVDVTDELETFAFRPAIATSA
jgi:uncharacterized OB-fold protein